MKDNFLFWSSTQSYLDSNSNRHCTIKQNLLFSYKISKQGSKFLDISVEEFYNFKAL